MRLSLRLAVALAAIATHAPSASLSGSLTRMQDPCTSASAEKTKRSFKRHARNGVFTRHAVQQKDTVTITKKQFRGAPKDARVNKRKTYMEKIKKR